MNKRLTKSNDRCLSGVCGGIAEYFDLDPTLVRIGYAALTAFLAGFLGIILYFIMASVVPKASLKDRTYQVKNHNELK